MIKRHFTRILLAAICGLVTVLSMVAFGAAPKINTQAPAYYRLVVGDYEVTALSDGTNPLAATKLLRGDPSKITEALKRNFLGDQVETSHNSYLVNTGAKLVLIDAGAGRMLGPHTGDLLNNLRAAGYRPEQVDEIYITHMHTDHVGGLVANGQPAFPNAIVRVDKSDADYWLSEINMNAAPAEMKRFFQAAIAAFTPYLKADKVKVFEGNVELVPGIRAKSEHGHTPGHTAYVVGSRGDKVVFWGDIVHVAAVQFDDPSVTIAYDVKAAEAKHTRELALADAAANGYLVGGAHVAFPGLGHVRRRNSDNSYVFVPLNYSSLK
jgi:glyoxylase-like metal-dependent hydrolase (beta-lactamase superfamily II)